LPLIRGGIQIDLHLGLAGEDSMSRSKSMGFLRTSTMSKLRLSLPAIAVAAVASASASGSAIVSFSQQDSPYSVSSSDLLEGLTPVSATTTYYNGSVDGSASGGLACITDGLMANSTSQVVAVGTVGSEGGYSSGYTDLIYNFASPVNLSALNFYYYWGGDRNNPPPMTISVNTAATSLSTGSWTTVITTPEYDATGSSDSEASVTDSAGAPIATGIQSLQITFGGVLNGWSGLGEIDAIQGTPEPATLGIASVVCGVGLLRRRGKSHSMLAPNAVG
jgi:hypothetical protein